MKMNSIAFNDGSRITLTDEQLFTIGQFYQKKCFREDAEECLDQLVSDNAKAKIESQGLWETIVQEAADAYEEQTMGYSQWDYLFERMENCVIHACEDNEIDLSEDEEDC